MSRLQSLSEADVRLRLYPSSGRVVKVTEGYWPERRDRLAESCAVHTARADGLFPTITVDVMLSDEARLPISDTIKLYLQGQAARHFRLKAMGLPCDCTVCEAMNPTETCRYMADPANWHDATFTAGVELKWPGTGKDGPWNAQKLAAMALSDETEIVKVDLRSEIRREPRPCTVCHKPIAPGTAYVVRGPKHVRCAGPRR